MKKQLTIGLILVALAIGVVIFGYCQSNQTTNNKPTTPSNQYQIRINP